MSIPWGWISFGVLAGSYLNNQARREQQLSDQILEHTVEIEQARQSVDDAKQECLNAEAVRLAKVAEVQHELDDVAAQMDRMKKLLEERVRQEQQAKQSNGA
jgi:hypothetical protein